MRLILATLCTLLVAAPAAAAAPDVTTGPADPVGQTTATLTGTVDPNSVATPYHFEYGTTATYGLTTAEGAAGAGDDPVAVQAAVSGLTAATTYHYRLVAGGVAGGDRTFTTTAAPANPSPPGISGLRATDRTAHAARLTARIDPNRAATTWHVEWGLTTALGNRTPERSLPAGDVAVAVAEPLAGLPASTRVYWRVVATNAAGVRRSGRTSFTTARELTGTVLSVLPQTTTWSGSLTFTGRVSGTGVNGIRVLLEESAFPFTAGWREVDSDRTDRGGAFAFAPREAFQATRYRAVPLVAPAAASAPEQTRVRARVRISRTHRTRRSLRLSGRVNPGLPAGRAILQRRMASGHWRGVRRRALRPVDAVDSTYSFRVLRAERARRYRVVVAARDGGAHARGYSRSLLVGARR
jgi:hypothetical protein